MNTTTSGIKAVTVNNRKFKLAFVNGLTVLRIVLAICFVVALLDMKHFWASLVLLVLLEGTDLADGKLARWWGVCTDWGAIFDPISDAISRVTVYTALVGGGLMFLPVIAVMAVRDALVALFRQVMIKNGAKANALFSGKAKACIQAGAATLVLVFAIVCDQNIQTQVSREIAMEVSWFVMVATTLSAIQYGWMAWKATKHAKLISLKDVVTICHQSDFTDENALPGQVQIGDPW